VLWDRVRRVVSRWGGQRRCGGPFGAPGHPLRRCGWKGGWGRWGRKTPGLDSGINLGRGGGTAGAPPPAAAPVGALAPWRPPAACIKPLGAAAGRAEAFAPRRGAGLRGARVDRLHRVRPERPGGRGRISRASRLDPGHDGGPAGGGPPPTGPTPPKPGRHRRPHRAGQVPRR